MIKKKTLPKSVKPLLENPLNRRKAENETGKTRTGSAPERGGQNRERSKGREYRTAQRKAAAQYGAHHKNTGSGRTHTTRKKILCGDDGRKQRVTIGQWRQARKEAAQKQKACAARLVITSNSSMIKATPCISSGHTAVQDFMDVSIQARERVESRKYNALRLVGSFHNAGTARLSVASNEESTKLQAMIDAAMKDKSLTPQQRAATIRALRERHKAEMAAIKRRIMLEELDRQKAGKKIQTALTA